MAPFVEGLRTRGIDAHAIDLPKRKAEDAIPAFHLAVPIRRQTSRSAATRSAAGWRVSPRPSRTPRTPRSCCSATRSTRPARPERTEARIAHWPSIRCPVLLLSGESDPFARIELLRATVPRLAERRARHLSAVSGTSCKPGPRRRARPGRRIPARRRVRLIQDRAKRSDPLPHARSRPILSPSPGATRQPRSRGKPHLVAIGADQGRGPRPTPAPIAARPSFGVLTTPSR